MQALQRTQPALPMGLGDAAGYSRAYVRPGPTTLFAALGSAPGEGCGLGRKRHRREEFPAFPRRIDREAPAESDLPRALDHSATHKPAKVKRGLAARPRLHLPCPPPSAAWWN